MSFLRSWNEKNNRVVVFAGVFDPVHIAHISAAEEALEKSGSKLVFLPERIPQHKKNVTEYKHRLEMLKIATKLQLNMEVLDYPREKQYIEETFTWLNEHLPKCNFVWLVGSDVLEKIQKWPGHEKLSSLGVKQILVFIRAGDVALEIKEISGVEVVYKKRNRSMLNHEKISSSFILSDMEHRQSALPQGVYDYIKKNKLYKVSDSLTE